MNTFITILFTIITILFFLVSFGEKKDETKKQYIHATVIFATLVAFLVKFG